VAQEGITGTMEDTVIQYQGLYSSYGSTQDILTGDLTRDYETWLNTDPSGRMKLGYSEEVSA
jgi:hypothetical protein